MQWIWCKSRAGLWTIDFGLMAEDEAAQYEMPFEYVRKYVLPIRQTRRDDYRGQWWQYARPRPDLRVALHGKSRYIVTPRVSKHRIFSWLGPTVLANDATVVLARDDDYFFGVLHSRAHELWARRLGTQLREAESGFRYTPTTCFETFSFPWPPGQEPADDPRVEAIAQAARELVQLRDAWLNPPGASDAELKKRTLTNLYNARPTWLDNAHRKLDAAVFAAYGWPATLTDDEILASSASAQSGAPNVGLAARPRPTPRPSSLTPRSETRDVSLLHWPPTLRQPFDKLRMIAQGTICPMRKSWRGCWRSTWHSAGGK